MNQESPFNIKKALRIGFVVLIIGLFLAFFFLNIYSLPPRTPFDKWYRNWAAVVMASVVFLFFLFFLTRPRRPKEWHGAGLTTAFFISLFTEMFGIPLTIYLIAPLLGVEPRVFGMHESHLWAYLLSRTGVVAIETGVYIVMVVSTALLVLGFTLLSVGWKEIYQGEGALVTNGLYARMRHPQYLGLILIVIAFLIQWPTLLTLLLAPFLTARYILLAREEDRELEEMFGEEFRRYRENAPGFVPIKGRIRWIMSILLLWMFGLAILPGIGGSQNLSVEETLAALGKGPTLGREMASVTIVEFSDFQCSFCKKFWTDTLPKIKETYIQKGQVRLIYRHFAILGKNSLQAGQAAECAGEQGKFWEYHDKLFANQGKVLTDANLKGYAREVGLDASGFARCLSSNRYKDKVEGETAVAAFLGARGTPTFFINGRLLVGAQPFDVFQGVIEGQLKEAVSKKKK